MQWGGINVEIVCDVRKPFSSRLGCFFIAYILSMLYFALWNYFMIKIEHFCTHIVDKQKYNGFLSNKMHKRLIKNIYL